MDYAVVGLILFALIYLYLLRAIRREAKLLSDSMNLDAQRGFVMKRSLMDSAREHERESKLVRSVLAHERDAINELSLYATHSPANRLNRGSRQVS